MALNALFSAGTVLMTVAIVSCSLVALVVSLAAIRRSPPNMLPEVNQHLVVDHAEDETSPGVR